MNNQSTSHLFMIEPESFYGNEQTASSNHYQINDIDESPEEIASKALNEFNNFKNWLYISPYHLNEKYFEEISLLNSKL